ncbi:MAG TPA: Coenzyme F420 hydrogenase/dehydrogenase, beta subunit C-terminal domain [Roseiflexaceae bacterium]|nr:Coenzyme F420 hydrogenase/dehydrogenase, beta subunit C-terminal domain [Roseiflexaceae bacterium]
METGPTKGLQTISLLSQDARLKGRPKLCSDCGFCDTTLRPHMAQSCVFVENRTAELERRFHGRARETADEQLFGVYQRMLAARLRPANPQAQWSGITTRLGALLLERGLVDAVLTTRAVPGTRFAPQPFLARTPAEVIASAGNKPCLSPGLSLLDELRAAGVRRLAAIGVGCQVHALRAAQDQLGLAQLYVVGIPCSDNVAYPDLTRFLELVSRSPATVVHYEFMQDFSVHLRHEDGRIERCNFIDIPMGELGDVFPSACLSCFDYANGLADLTVGYMGAEQGWQWLLVRNERGEALLELLRPLLELGVLGSRGDRRAGVARYAGMLARPPARPPALVRRLIAALMRRRGPRGLEFARSVIEMKLLRNLRHVRDRFGRLERRIVPGHVYAALAPYAEPYRRAFDQPLEPVGTRNHEGHEGHGWQNV